MITVIVLSVEKKYDRGIINMKPRVLENKQSLSERSRRVELSRDEYMYAICSAIKNDEAYESTPKRKSSIQSNCEGAVGEMIACKYFGAEFEGGDTDGWDMDVDTVIDGTPADIKTDAREFYDPKLLIKKPLVENGGAKLYILVRLNVEDGVVPGWGDIVGYGYSDRIEQFRPYRYPLNTVNYVLDWRLTKPISDLDSMKASERGVVIESLSSDMMKHIDTEWL